MEPLSIDFESELIEKPTTSQELNHNPMYSRPVKQDVYDFTIKYPFTGSAGIFRIRPSRFTLTTAEIHVDESSATVEIHFRLWKQDTDEFNKAKNDKKSSDGLLCR